MTLMGRYIAIDWLSLPGFIVIFAAAYLFFVPTVIAFVRAHHSFWKIAAVNLVLGITGIGWLGALAWSLSPVERPDPSLEAMQHTKTYDLIVALPLVLWYANGIRQQRPTIVYNADMIAAGSANLLIILQLFAVMASLAFNLLLIYMLFVRSGPLRKSKGLWPRLTAFAGSFLGVGIIALKPQPLPLAWLMVSDVFLFAGAAGSAYVLWQLGKSFSIMPEARKLVTSGIYARVRHPLYTAEMLSIIGAAIFYTQPWAALIGAGVLVLQYLRTVFEERVLTEAFPEYEVYRARTWRFVPGVL